MKDLSTSPDTVSHTDENIGTELMDLDLREDFRSLTTKAREIKAKVNEWGISN